MPSPAAYYWEGELIPFSTQEEVVDPDTQLPKEGAIIFVRPMDSEGDPIDEIVAATVLTRTHELWYAPIEDGELPDNNGVMTHKIVLVRRSK